MDEDEPDPFASNPYAPTSHVSPEEPQTEIEKYRRQYLNHEASVKSIGTLYLIGAIFLIPMGLVVLVNGMAMQARMEIMLTEGGVFFGLGTIQFISAIGLWFLRPWGRRVGFAPAVIWLLAIPFGTLISIYLIYLLASKKSDVVFSKQYKEVMAQTPHIKYRMSRIVWALLILVLVLIGLGLVATLIGSAS